MKIKSEFKLIESIEKQFSLFDKNILKGIGDDVAVIKNGQEFLLATTDMLVEDDHFNRKWSTPEQIGKKAVEVNVSDIISTGGAPTNMLISIALIPGTNFNWITKVFKGIKKAANKHKISLVGGDTTHGKTCVINVCLLGTTKKPILRSTAKPGELICVTGKLGGSSAGLKLFQKNKKLPPNLKKRHLEPKARIDVTKSIFKYVTSMIDISDGLASEVKHICKQSKTGAIIFQDKIPLEKNACLIDALSGGEDFELLFTIKKNNLNKMENITVVGEIKNKSYGIWLIEGNKKIKMPGGYDHFKN